METIRPAFISRTTERLDKVAADNGWVRNQNNLGDIVSYRKGSKHMNVGVSVSGRVTWVSASHGHAVGAGKADWAVDVLEGL